MADGLVTTPAPIGTPSQIASAFEAVRQRIVAAGGSDVELVAVTKGFGVEAILAAADNGAAAVGENYVQELVSKMDQLSSREEIAPSNGGKPPKIFFIGQLQTNKVKYLAGRVARYASVDRPNLIREIAKRDPGAEVLLQVVPDAVRSDGKGGCGLDEVDRLAELATAQGLVVQGLMTIGPTDRSPVATAAGFAEVRRAVDRLGLSVCSMGMSADLEVAIAEGSTEVRIGSALFGKR